MSRHSNEDHNAWIRDQKTIARRNQIADWLEANPEIGRLSSGKFYKFENGQQVTVIAPK